MKKTNVAICLAACLLAMTAQAESQGALLQKNKMSIGAGLSSNSVANSDNETGFQFFGAYDLDRVNLIEGADSSVEVGYMDYGFSQGDAGGLWANYVLDGAIRDGLGWLVRLGLDFGDDSGLMFGAGIGINVNSATQLRFEYVIRDDVDSLQFNLIYHL